MAVKTDSQRRIIIHTFFSSIYGICCLPSSIINKNFCGINEKKHKKNACLKSLPMKSEFFHSCSVNTLLNIQENMTFQINKYDDGGETQNINYGSEYYI